MESEELISILIQLSKVDNNFDAFEFTFILNVAEEIGLNQFQVERIIKHGGVDSLHIPRTEEERMTVLYYLLFLMKIDTVITSKEKELVHHYGFKLGFSSVMIDDFIALVEKHKNDRIPVEDMIAIIKKYKN